MTASGAALLLLLSLLLAAHRAAADPRQQQVWLDTGDVASSGTGSDASGGTSLPAGVHLALGDRDDEMVVAWSTQLPTQQSCVQFFAVGPPARAASGGPAAAQPLQHPQQLVGPRLPGAAAASAVAEIGSSSSLSRRLQTLQASDTAAGTATAGSASQPAPPPEVHTACGSSATLIEPATVQPSLHLHTTTLRGLAPGQPYRYRCGSEAGGWSGWLVLRAKRSATQFSPEAPVSAVLRFACFLCGPARAEDSQQCSSGVGNAGRPMQPAPYRQQSPGPQAAFASHISPPTLCRHRGHRPCAVCLPWPCLQAQLLLVGDMGYYNSRAYGDLLAAAATGRYDAVLHVGDIAYDMQVSLF
jgi:hypothetical protein